MKAIRNVNWLDALLAVLVGACAVALMTGCATAPVAYQPTRGQTAEQTNTDRDACMASHKFVCVASWPMPCDMNLYVVACMEAKGYEWPR